MKFQIAAPNLLKNVLWDLKWHCRNLLAKRPSGFWEESLFVRSASTFRGGRESHFATHPYLLAKRTWSRLTIPLWPVRKGPPRPNLTCFQGNKVFLHLLIDKALLESHSKGATKNPIDLCEQQPDLAGLSEGDVLCSKTCAACSSSNSMKRRVSGGCMTRSTCPSVAKRLTSSRPWSRGASVILITPRMVRNGLKGEGGLYFRGWG